MNVASAVWRQYRGSMNVASAVWRQYRGSMNVASAVWRCICLFGYLTTTRFTHAHHTPHHTIHHHTCTPHTIPHTPPYPPYHTLYQTPYHITHHTPYCTSQSKAQATSTPFDSFKKTSPEPYPEDLTFDPHKGVDEDYEGPETEI